MRPGTDEAGAAPDAEALAGEGASYARSFLDRIGKGAASPDELAALMQFLHSGAMLHGACAVIVAALHRAAHTIGGPR